MKLVENMTLQELEANKKIQLQRIDTAKSALEKIHGQKNYQDEVAKYFVGGMVGFRKDRKRVSRSINQYTENAKKACGHYDAIKDAESRIRLIDKAVNFITENSNIGETVRQIKETRIKAAVDSAKALKWERVAGHYGTAYRHGGFLVGLVEPGFAAVWDASGSLLSHHKTMKEAKAAVALRIERLAGVLGRGEAERDE